MLIKNTLIFLLVVFNLFNRLKVTCGKNADLMKNVLVLKYRVFYTDEGEGKRQYLELAETYSLGSENFYNLKKFSYTGNDYLKVDLQL